MRLSRAAIALVGLAACASYSGGARSIDPARMTTEPGWIAAASTPELRQEGLRDCGAAALAMIAGRWHVLLSVDDAVAKLPAGEKARLGDLRDLARARGLAAFAIAGDRETLVHELRLGRPVIIGLLLPYGQHHVRSHYEVVVAVSSDASEFVTIDPARGWRARSWTDLDTEWQPAGRPTLVVLGIDPRSRTWYASTPSATSATAAAGVRFSSSRSFTDTRPADARIRGHVLLRELDVVFVDVRIVLDDLLHGRAAPRHLADLPHREAALGEDGLAAEDVVSSDELLLPLREPLDPILDIVHGRRELHLEVAAELDAVGQLALVQRGGERTSPITSNAAIGGGTFGILELPSKTFKVYRAADGFEIEIPRPTVASSRSP